MDAYPTQAQRNEFLWRNIRALTRQTGVSNSQVRESIRDNAQVDNTTGRAASGVQSESVPLPVVPKRIDILSVTTSLPIGTFQAQVPNSVSGGGPSDPGASGNTTLVVFANGILAEGNFTGGPLTPI